jgi:heavy metal sensor kinase
LTTKSISFRLTCWFSSIFLGGFVVFGVVMWFDLARELGIGRDRTLNRRATRCMELLTAIQNDDATRQAHKFEEFSDATPEGNLIHVYDKVGQPLYEGTPAPPDFPWPPLSHEPGDHYVDVKFDGRIFRVLTRTTQLASNPLTIRVAGQLEDNRQLLARFQTGLEAATPVLLVVSALCGYMLSRRALKPVARLTTTVRSISIGNLSGRLPIHPTRDELQRLGETFNDMLARLESAVSRINRFTADASHELRSPISFTRTVSEYALQHHELDADTRQVFEDILAESEEAGRLLEDMLTLARADAGRLDAPMEPLDLAQILVEVSDKAKALAEAKEITFACHGLNGKPILITGDRSSLRRLFWALLDNAVKYTPGGGRIDVDLTGSGPQAFVRVRDSGIGIPEELLPRIFDRFFRVDASRSQSDGTGLGLAIAKWIAESHRATLSVRNNDGPGTVFEVVFQVLSSHPAALTAT